jgi:hypothetical protein
MCLKDADKFWDTSFTYQNKKRVHMCPDIWYMCVTAERILCRHQQQFSINVWAGIVDDWYGRMFYHIGLQATTTEISSYVICQSYWNMYHWQSEHECVTCVMVLWHILAVLSNTCHGRWIGTGVPTAWPPLSPDLNPLNFYPWGHQNTPCVCSSCWQRRGTSSHCGCVSYYPPLPWHLWTDAAVEACIESRGGHFEQRSFIGCILLQV